MNKKLIAIIISALILVVGGIGVYTIAQNNNSDSKTENITVQVKNETTWENNVLTIKAAEVKNALEMMQQNATIVTNGTGENAFLVSINGVETDSDKNEFWGFYVDGTMASVGVGSYTTKVGDVLTFKISTY